MTTTKKPRTAGRKPTRNLLKAGREQRPIELLPSLISGVDALRVDEGERDESIFEDVQLSTSPWVSGTRSAVYFGPIHSELFLHDELPQNRVAACAMWGKAVQELLEALRDRARALGANAVVGLAVSLDPFARSKSGVKGMRLRSVGTAVRTDPLA